MSTPSQSIEKMRPILAKGGMILITNRQKPEEGAAIITAASSTSDGVINFLATHARGLTAVAMLPDRAARLGLELQNTEGDPQGPAEAWLVTTEASVGVSTGISAADRARTVQVLADPDARPADLIAPGHVHPILADPAGLIGREGFPEAAVDALRLAGLPPVATLCHILDDAGELLTDEIDAYAHTHGLQVIDFAELREYRLQTELFVHQLAQAILPTKYGDFLVQAFENRLDGHQHLALSLGDLRGPDAPLIRLHSECLTGDVFHSRRCDCGAQLDTAMRLIREEGRGAILYLRQEGRGVGLLNKIRAYTLQDEGRDTVEANVELGLPVDGRDYGIAGQILHTLGVQKIRLLTNNPLKVQTLEELGIEIAQRIPLVIPPTEDSRAYLDTKANKLGHYL